MKWGRVRLWWLSARFPKRASRLQHDQAIEEHAVVVDEFRRDRKRITHDLADKVLELDAVTDQLEVVAEEIDETDPRPHP